MARRFFAVGFLFFFSFGWVRCWGGPHCDRSHDPPVRSNWSLLCRVLSFIFPMHRPTTLASNHNQFAGRPCRCETSKNITVRSKTGGFFLFLLFFSRRPPWTQTSPQGPVHHAIILTQGIEPPPPPRKYSQYLPFLFNFGKSPRTGVPGIQLAELRNLSSLPLFELSVRIIDLGVPFNLPAP